MLPQLLNVIVAYDMVILKIILKVQRNASTVQGIFIPKKGIIYPVHPVVFSVKIHTNRTSENAQSIHDRKTIKS